MNTTTSSYQPPTLSGSGYDWRPAPVNYHGRHLDDRQTVAAGRRALTGNWPADRPEECLYPSSEGIWVAKDRVLACRGCGLDLT